MIYWPKKVREAGKILLMNQEAVFARTFG